ncbi:hypothetical protein ACVIW3_006793 [Bradyrhizobium diazoefficiens]
MELVAPEAKLITGKAVAISACITVPSFWVRNSGASMPLSAIALRKAATVVTARSCREALSSAAFSRSSRPMRPRSCDSVTATSGQISARISRAVVSQEGSSGEKLEHTATERRPLSLIFRAASFSPAVSSGMNGRPS